MAYKRLKKIKDIRAELTATYQFKFYTKDKNKLITIYKKEFIWRFDMDQISQVIDKSLYYSYGLFPEPKD